VDSLGLLLAVVVTAAAVDAVRVPLPPPKYVLEQEATGIGE
jgi:hypothetical protein